MRFFKDFIFFRKAPPRDLVREQFEASRSQFDNAMIDAQMYGSGYIKLRPDGTFVHTPFEQIQMAPLPEIEFALVEEDLT